MPDLPAFSKRLLDNPEAANKEALARIAIGKRRVQSVLDREIVAHTRTLEQKIAEQGPRGVRVDPHLLSLSVMDLIELNRLTVHRHVATGNRPWFSNPGAPAEAVQTRLHELAPLYDSVSSHGFGNHIGDALEIVVFKCLERVQQATPRHAYMGHFQLGAQKDTQGRYRKVQPPKQLGLMGTVKEADFLQFGYDAGTLCIECKNYREWIYPREQAIRDLIIKASDLGTIPLLVARRLHYTTISNLLEPAGIIAHETYYQYYPADKVDLAARVKDKHSLGFTDVTATEDPHPRTVRFFSELLPRIVDPMGEKWNRNKAALLDFAGGALNLAQLYNAIGSPAAGNWKELEESGNEHGDE